MHFNSFPSTTKRNWVGHHNEKGTSWGLLHWFFQEKGCVGVWKWEFFVLSRVETKQGMKQLKDHKVMDPQFLILLFSNVAILVGLKRGHNACTKLMMKLGGRGPKFVKVKTPRSNMTSLLVHKIFFCHWVTLTEAKLD